MKEFFSVLFGLLAVAAFAAPTANEDYVDRQDATTYTNAVNAAKAYTDGAITASGAVTPEITTNISRYVAAAVVTNDVGVFSPWTTGQHYYHEYSPGMVMNVTNMAVRWSNGRWQMRVVGKTPGGMVDSWFDLVKSTGCLEVYSDIDDVTAYLTSVSPFDEGVCLALKTERYVVTTRNALGLAYEKDVVPKTLKINGQPLTNDVTIQAGVVSVNTKTGAVSLNANDVGAYGAAAGSALAAQVLTIGAHLNAEDARFVVTNYNSATHTPEAYVEIKLPDQSWSLIWSEMTRWNYLFNDYLPTNYYTKGHVDTALSQKADRAWGAYDSETGGYSPDGYTWISSPKIAIAAGLAYQRTITAEGSIWVLTSNGTVTQTGGLTNGYFRVSDDEGNAMFEIVKGSKRTVGADASSCQVVAAFTPTKLRIVYSVVSDSHPTISVCNSLETSLWKLETDADCLANVVWSGSSGGWVAEVQGKTAQASLFVKASYEVGGESIVRNVAPVSMQYVIIGGVKYSVGTETISGTTVIKLTVSQ